MFSSVVFFVIDSLFVFKLFFEISGYSIFLDIKMFIEFLTVFAPHKR